MRDFLYQKNILITSAISLLLLIFITIQNINNDSAEPNAANSNYSEEVASTGGTNSAEQDSSQKNLMDAPDFTLETMEGEPFTLSSHEGKVVVLNIWATWCPPCREEIPDFIELQDEMEEDDVLFVGVSVDEEGWEVVRPFAKEFGINYPLVVDNGDIYQKYGPFHGIPTTFLINKKGQVEYMAPGMLTKDILKPILVEMSNQ